ncbi:cystine transport system substrate-binding protein [Seinonella peptonophila]|uniref:Cystine transport system substrate-binding protein n=1 Tax=Seinonella peptonophila TaxID=112248 RepID=A0A1M4TQ78_9BACL|nr:transporter substrate-binding domain-containing protein [Seinonella peptonophila]SHE46545.1 cystine transport system substrate-binding protein [Seinonella peptonophila]
MMSRLRMLGFSLLSVMILLSVVLTGCSVEKKAEGDLLDQIKKRGTILIGTEGTYSPFSFHEKKGNKLTGFDVEIAEELAKRIGVKAQFVETPWDGMLSSLQTGKIDIVANQVGVKEERKKKFDFTNPYTISYAEIVVHKDNQTIKGVADIKGKTAGQTSTSNYGKYARDAKAEVKVYEDMMSAMWDVANKRIDVSINDRLAIAEMMKKEKLPLKVVGEPIEKVEIAFPVEKGNPKLLAELNRALDEMRKDGTLKEISEKYFGKDITQ